ncbi:BRCA2-interacting transcriptional repressor EMSY isoform X2 [Microplitis mediator]|uniref:BRCA2-interacting transcriptional repressor EMSY isoform X2 n=1 Tax=Microplitis mediator TaxID=375433 RepID=UPI002555BB4E|nr:BRCA2-interacting transcriptional repressor EMSY isoform X2 [Microplitis mediator]
MRSIRMDLSRDDCRKCLRCLELDAYGNMVSVLRAQGSFTEDKKRLLEEIAKVLHISNERHRAEVRRAVNDEKLSYIAEQLNGPNTWTDWAIEGRRMIPLLPRLKAHTAFTELANSLSLVLAAANEKKAPVLKNNDTIVNTNTIVKNKLESRQEVEDKLPLQNLISNPPKSTRGRKRKKPLADADNGNKKLISQACVNDNDSNGNCMRESGSLPATSEDKVTENTSKSELINERLVINSTCTVTPTVMSCNDSTNDISNSSNIINEIPQTNTAIDIKCDVELKLDECINHEKSNDPPIIDKNEPVAEEPAESVVGRSSPPSSQINSVIVSNIKRIAAVNEDTSSSGPGPPQINSSMVTFKKLPMEKLNSQSITKAAIGKVIMGSENLCLAAKTAAAALLPHRLASNGDRKLNIVPIKNSSHVDIKSNTKLNNMVVVDIQQDVPEEKLISISNTLETHEINEFPDNSDSLTLDESALITDQVIDSVDNLNNKLDGHKNVADDQSNEESVEASDIAQDSCQEIVMITEEEFVETQVLDGQTEIYNFEPTEDNVCEVQLDETDSETVVEVFNTEPMEIDESLNYTEDEEAI